MALVITNVKKVSLQGQVWEYGVWTLTGGDTTGLITPSLAGSPDPGDPIEFTATSGTSSAALVCSNVSPTSLRITSAANDNGRYCYKAEAV